ncbi:MAG: leucyl aminopeptidase [Candidatus Moraniibacteriota bacterium]|nr:MAG: leucyl aminopeptidase [Candidatus Moranbacteria bacterium]
MKITVLEKNAKKECVRVVFSENIGGNRFCSDGKRGILEMKVPKKEEMTRRQWIVFVRSIILEAKKHKIDRLEIIWKDLVAFDKLGNDLAKIFAEAVYMADYEFRKYKKKPEEGWHNIAEVILLINKKDKTFVRQNLRRGATIAKQVNFCRDLANTPGADMTPIHLVSVVRKMIKGTALKLRVLDEKQMRRKKMNGVLTVGQGSSVQSRFIILEYAGAGENTKPTVLVGKGVTFDSGGIDTKPHPHGLEMMMDMSGAAAVVATILVAEKLGLKKNIVALIPAVENMPSGSSVRPGDIITMMDGTHVEVGHTDAEGRLILADALTFAKSFNPKQVIDVATLTGAAMVALGERASAIFTDNEELAQKTIISAEKTGDDVWRLPLWDEYAAEIAGTYGDIANIRTKGQSGAGGAITAAMFLKNFAKDYVDNWMHIDIAPTMTAVFDENLAKGAKGSPVRLLVELLS